jgi:hypothetical protein
MSGEVIATLTSRDGRYRAEVLKRPVGGFQVLVSRWTEEWVPDYGKVGEFWASVGRGATFTDTSERAEELAREHFLMWESQDGAI